MPGMYSAEEQLPEDIQERIHLIRHKLKFIDQKPQVAFIDGLSPLTIQGSPASELIEIAGGSSVLTEAGKISLVISFEMLQAANPDIIIISPKGFTIARTLQEMEILFNQSGWNELKAVQNDGVYLADGSEYCHQQGRQLADNLEILAEIIHPKQFIFGYEGSGWIKFSTK